jgi:hypothetical protein
MKCSFSVTSFTLGFRLFLNLLQINLLKNPTNKCRGVGQKMSRYPQKRREGKKRLVKLIQKF